MSWFDELLSTTIQADPELRIPTQPTGEHRERCDQIITAACVQDTVANWNSLYSASAALAGWFTHEHGRRPQACEKSAGPLAGSRRRTVVRSRSSTAER